MLTFSDGFTTLSLPPAQDHKRAFDGDEGPNTGGMGCYAPTPIATPELLRQIQDTIVQPTIDGLRRDRMPFVGVLFTGLMITSAGPKVLEYNVRFGDPETQTLLPLLTDDTDFALVLLACACHCLDSVKVGVKQEYSCAVVCAAGGYPGSYAKGHRITIHDTSSHPGVEIFHAGTAVDANGHLVTAGGRVIAVSATGATLQDAVAHAYRGMETVTFEGQYFRRDIAHRALNATKPSGLTYRAAGVSVDNGNALVERIKPFVKATRRVGAAAEIGGFGGVFDLKPCNFTDPLLVGATDGVGTKLLLAISLDKHDTVGIDLVAMNVNDLVAQGAEPLMFLDYYASAHLDVDRCADFVKGVAVGCQRAGCALVGGETSEMPGVYPEGHYDTNGTAVGAIERDRVLPRTADMREGDVLVGLASDGAHSNGYSLIRRVFEQSTAAYTDPCPWDADMSLGECFLKPTRIYVKPVLELVKQSLIKGVAHITGGGLYENTPRMLPKTGELSARLDAARWPCPAEFAWLRRQGGGIAAKEMARTFNMGLGMVLVVDAGLASKVVECLSGAGERAYVVGELVRSGSGVAECLIDNLNVWE